MGITQPLSPLYYTMILDGNLEPPFQFIFPFKTDCWLSIEGVILNLNPVTSLILVFLNNTFCLLKPSLFWSGLFQDFWTLTQVIVPQ